MDHGFHGVVDYFYMSIWYSAYIRVKSTYNNIKLNPLLVRHSPKDSPLVGWLLSAGVSLWLMVKSSLVHWYSSIINSMLAFSILLLVYCCHLQALITIFLAESPQYTDRNVQNAVLNSTLVRWLLETSFLYCWWWNQYRIHIKSH